MRRLLTVLLVACAAAWALMPGAAWAHDVLIGSDPAEGARLDAAPSEVTLVFNTAVRTGYAHVNVTGPGGTSWADGGAVVRKERVSVKVRPLGAAGEYVVGYRILSSDGHPVAGKVTFTLTKPGPGAAAPAATPAATASASASADASTDASASADASDASTNATASPGSAAATGDGPGTAGGNQSGPAAVSPTGASSAAPDLSTQAAEAAANGGAGMAVLWIGGALLVLAAGTVVALRRSPRDAEPGAPGESDAPVEPSGADDRASVGSGGEDRA
ncbi:copper resistance protein CopC [Nonomuraea sp. NPDC050663]|uniref:copper resistance protein CopC n=1 Tax=Nonomuraea sp. NPDC050663 TaxID=3364370 RepID=UPI00379D03DF